ncbi:MAG TPA: hypothetical protein VLD35_11420 [Caldimonas sp.]|nr:hypothetical protein [Caldimonas sp.]
MADFDVHEPTRITSGPAVDLRPQWDADARTIVFERKTPSGSALHRLHVAGDLAGQTEALALCNEGARTVQGRVAFFGRDRFAFVSDRAGRPAIWLADLARRLIEPLTQPAADEADDGPTASPAMDGQFSFFRIIGSGRPHLFVGRVGEIVQPLTINRDFGDQPWFVPDTHRLVFHSRRSGDDRVFEQEARHGAAARPVSDRDELTPCVTPFPSPDGKHIVFASAVSGESQIWAMRIDGSNRQQLTFGSIASSFPAWSPTGDDIVFVRGDPLAAAPSGALWKLSLRRR